MPDRIAPARLLGKHPSMRPAKRCRLLQTASYTPRVERPARFYTQSMQRVDRFFGIRAALLPARSWPRRLLQTVWCTQAPGTDVCTLSDYNVERYINASKDRARASGEK